MSLVTGDDGPCWTYAVQYALNTAKKHKSFNDGVLKYYPGPRRAVLMDAQEVVIEELLPVMAGGLFPGGQIDLEKHIVIVGDSLAETKKASAPKRMVPTSAPLKRHIRSGAIPVHSMPDPPLGDCHELLYTTDKVKKIKKWIDGKVEWKNGEAIFYDDESKSFYRKKMPRDDLQDGAELSAAQYLFQMGPVCGPPMKRVATKNTDDIVKEFNSPLTEIASDSKIVRPSKIISKKPQAKPYSTTSEPKFESNPGRTSINRISHLMFYYRRFSCEHAVKKERPNVNITNVNISSIEFHDINTSSSYNK